MLALMLGKCAGKNRKRHLLHHVKPTVAIWLGQENKLKAGPPVLVKTPLKTAIVHHIQEEKKTIFNFLKTIID